MIILIPCLKHNDCKFMCNTVSIYSLHGVQIHMIGANNYSKCLICKK